MGHEKIQISWEFQSQIHRKMADFTANSQKFSGQISLKIISKNQLISCNFLGIFHWKAIGVVLI